MRTQTPVPNLKHFATHSMRTLHQMHKVPKTMKKTTFEDTVASYDDKIAMIMAVGDAVIEDASWALAECDGDIDRALELLYNQAPPTGLIASSPNHKKAPYKPSRKACRTEDVDDESAAKPSVSFRHAPSLVAPPRTAARDSAKKGKDIVI